MSPSAEKDEPGASSIVTHEHAPPASDPPPPAADPRGIVTASTPHQGAGGSAKKKKKEAEHVGAVEVPFATAQKHDTEEIAWFSQRRNRCMLFLILVLVIGSFVAVVIPVPPRGSNGKGSSERGEASTSCVGYEACSGDTGTGSCVGPSACRGSTSLTVSEGSCIGKSNFLME